MQSHVMLSALCLSLAACSSGSDDPGSTTSTANVRIATLTTDVGADGVADFLVEYAYDDTGRIVSVSETSLRTMADPFIVTYSYGADGLAMRSDRFETESFFYEAGNISRTESTSQFADEFQYTYDSTGRLSTVTGDAFFYDNDCSTGFGLESDAQVYQLGYTGNRLTSITGSLGDVTSLSYNGQGRLTTLASTGGCNGAYDTTLTFSYGANGRPSGLRTVTVDPEFGDDRSINVLETSYANGLLASTVESELVGIDSDSTTSTFTYDENGLLIGSTVTAEETFSGNINTTSIAVSITYEDGSCVAQQTAYPHVAVFLDLQPAFQPADAALACTYNLDNF